MLKKKKSRELLRLTLQLLADLKLELSFHYSKFKYFLSYYWLKKKYLRFEYEIPRSIFSYKAEIEINLAT